jgi:tRNA pseudouridine38-40 synthase
MNRSLSERVRYALTVEYDGSKFNGWQAQRGVPTVQEALEVALSRVGNHLVRVTGAGRTDTGVHATAQVAHFESSSPRSIRAWLRGGNTWLPSGVAILSVLPVALDFHARFSATGRAYRYVIFNRSVAPTFLRRRVTWEYRPMDVSRMQAAAAFLIGRHDFSAYRAAGCQSKGPIRELRRLSVSSNGQWVWVDAEAESFLQHMVRNIVGVLLAVGAGEREPIWASEVLNSRDRLSGGVTAPPDGLYFTRAIYPKPFELPKVPECRFW